DGRDRPHPPERRPRSRADDPHVRGRRGPDPSLGRRRHRLGLGSCRRGRGVVGEGAAAARRDRRADTRARGGLVTLLALGVLGRGIVPPDEPVLRADDEALLRGRAAFETLRVYGGRPFRLAQHLDRLAASASLIGLPQVDPDGLAATASEALAEAREEECVLRLFWTPGREDEGTPTRRARVPAPPPHPPPARA